MTSLSTEGIGLPLLQNFRDLYLYVIVYPSKTRVWIGALFLEMEKRTSCHNAVVGIA